MSISYWWCQSQELTIFARLTKCGLTFFWSLCKNPIRWQSNLWLKSIQVLSLRFCFVPNTTRVCSLTVDTPSWANVLNSFKRYSWGRVQYQSEAHFGIYVIPNNWFLAWPLFGIKGCRRSHYRALCPAMYNGFLIPPLPASPPNLLAAAIKMPFISPLMNSCPP